MGFQKLYERLLLPFPYIVIGIITISVIFLGFMARSFKLDASAESLLLEFDKDLKYSRQVNARYGVQDFLLITYSPNKDLLSPDVLNRIQQLKDELKKLGRVSSVLTLLDVPLLESPPVPIKELANNIKNLKSPGVDLYLARKEIKTSALYQNLLVSPDFKTTALIIYFKDDITYQELLSERNKYHDKIFDAQLTETESLALKNLNERIRQYRGKQSVFRHADILAIRSIMEKYRSDAELFLGGVQMVADDMITFIKNDLKLFGVGVFCLLVFTLGFIFKRVRWVLLPIFCCIFAVISMMGFLGMFGWNVTVISSNFISLQLIITMAIVIHLIVRFRELLYLKPEAPLNQLVQETVYSKFKPCLYAALTTIAGFSSLIFCDILPVINFGWMMSAGIIVSLIITFLLFPAVLMLLKREPTPHLAAVNPALTVFFAKFTEKNGRLILILTGISFIIIIMGISKLEVENSFIDYFKKSTEIYQGMKKLDQNLGGTTSLEIVIELENQAEETSPENTKKATDESMDNFDGFEEFEIAENEDKYWFTIDKMLLVEKIHNYLDGLQETGKVLSLATMLSIAKKFNKGQALDNFQLALIYSELPDNYKNLVLSPYVSIPHNEVRFSVRIKDSEPNLRRNTLLKKIRKDIIERFNLKPGQVHLAGMMVLYNNMLQSLFRSQILTIGAVVIALLIMFLILFRSFSVALIALFPNIFASSAVLGLMGWLKIPLDMMTITIAAISVGIAVDNTIHYIHRYKQEFQLSGNYLQCMHLCHGSIAHAMYYTSLTIIIGFSILAFSNFIPTIYFGIFTGLAMFIALIASLTLLPELIITFKPFGPEKR